MGSNIREFEMGLDRFVEDIDTNVGKVHRAVLLEGLKGVVQMTPVDKGRARANWQVSHGAPATDQVEATDKRGAATRARGAAVIAEAEPYSVTYLTNNVDYIEELENGSSQQAPSGMLNVTYNRLRAWLGRRR